MEFSAAAVAAGVETTVEAVEEQCGELARREQFLHARGTTEWPDGTVAARYGFVHALYQEVLYEQISASRRIRLHRQIGECEEQAYGARAREIATELAVHFERGRDYQRAVQYRQQAGATAIQRNAHHEAITHLTKGLELLKHLPDTPERTEQELALQITLGGALIPTKGYAAPEVGKAYARARELCQKSGETERLLPVLAGLATFSLVRAELQTTRELMERFLRLSQREQNPTALPIAHYVIGEILFHWGELTQARTHLEQGIILYNPEKRPFSAWNDPGVACLCIAAYTLWSLGYPDQALKRCNEALTLAQELSHPFSLAFALYGTARLHQFRRDVKKVREHAKPLIAISTEQGFALRAASGIILQGWMLAEQGQVEEGVAQVRQGLAAHQATGAELYRPYFLSVLAEAHGKVGQVEEGLIALTEALTAVNKTGERSYEAELYRLKGELTLQQWKVESQKSKTKRRK